KPPPELDDAVPVQIPHGSEAPGEALRRRARELIDSLAAIELPSAIAFLEFLASRGHKAEGRLSRSSSSPSPESLEMDSDSSGYDDALDDEEEDDDAPAPPVKSARRSSRGVTLAAAGKD